MALVAVLLIEMLITISSGDVGQPYLKALRNAGIDELVKYGPRGSLDTSFEDGLRINLFPQSLTSTRQSQNALQR